MCHPWLNYEGVRNSNYIILKNDDLKLQIFGEDFDQVLIIQWFKLKFCDWNEDHVIAGSPISNTSGLYPSTLSQGPWLGWFFCPQKKSTKGFSPEPHLIYFILHIFHEASKILILQNCVSFPVHLLGPQSHKKIDLPSSIKIITKN